MSFIPPSAAITSDKQLNIAIAGLGTVGTGTINLLRRHAALYTQRTGVSLHVCAVSTRDFSKSRTCDISSYRQVADARTFADDPDIDIVVEMIGGESGIAADLIEQSLKAGKICITANKALIASKGAYFLDIAQRTGGKLYFEAAVAGAIPILKILRESLASNAVHSVSGILNGTCNYILSRMEREGGSFENILQDAQQEGYAEADPSFDVDGIDAAHKTSIIAALAFGAPLNMDFSVTGIRSVTQKDIEAAKQQDCVIRLIGRVERKSDGSVSRKVSPEYVPASEKLGCVVGPDNAIFIQSNEAGDIFIQGAGAGMYATASSVVADIIDAARGIYAPALNNVCTA